MKSKKFLIRSLIASAIFGILALLVDQIAIQQEGVVRKLQSEGYEMEIENGLIENYFSHLASIEITSADMYNSIFTRYLIISKKDYESFVDPEILRRNCNGSSLGQGCYTFVDDFEILKRDTLSYIKIVRDSVFDDYVSLVMRTGQKEGTRDHIDGFTAQLTLAEKRIAELNQDTFQSKVYEDLDFFLNSINQNIYKLRKALEVASLDLHNKSIDQKALISNRMSYKQILLLLGVSFQIASLVSLLFFFRVFLNQINLKKPDSY